MKDVVSEQENIVLYGGGEKDGKILCCMVGERRTGKGKEGGGGDRDGFECINGNCIPESA